jgi:hypothetical protein
MISATGLQKNIFSLFKLASKSGATFKVHHKKVVYLVTLEPTKERFVTQTRLVMPKRRVTLRMNDCQECNGLIIAGICLNKKCANNNKKVMALSPPLEQKKEEG